MCTYVGMGFATMGQSVISTRQDHSIYKSNLVILNTVPKTKALMIPQIIIKVKAAATK